MTSGSPPKSATATPNSKYGSGNASRATRTRWCPCQRTSNSRGPTSCPIYCGNRRYETEVRTGTRNKSVTRDAFYLKTIVVGTVGFILYLYFVRTIITMTNYCRVPPAPISVNNIITLYSHCYSLQRLGWRKCLLWELATNPVWTSGRVRIK